MKWETKKNKEKFSQNRSKSKRYMFWNYEGCNAMNSTTSTRFKIFRHIAKIHKDSPDCVQFSYNKPYATSFNFQISFQVYTYKPMPSMALRIFVYVHLHISHVWIGYCTCGYFFLKLTTSGWCQRKVFKKLLCIVWCSMNGML